MATKHKPKVIRGSIASTPAFSIAREYQQGVTLITRGRSGLTSVSIQNLDSTEEVRFWHGLIPEDAFDTSNNNYLPEDPADWDSSQLTIAENLLSAYGERVSAGQYLEPYIPPNNQVYAYVASGTVKAHVKEG